MKNVLSVIVVLGVCFFNFTYSFASEIELKNLDLSTCYDVEQAERDLINGMRDVEEVHLESIQSNGGGGDNKMTIEQWDSIKSEATKGNILLTKDQVTLGYNHGHAAIVYQNCKKIIEAPGVGNLSTERDIDAWENFYTCKLMYPASPDFETRKSAADMAKEKYVGWEYAIAPSRSSTKYLNCATLVWRAYNDVGVVLGYANADTVTPRNLLEGGGLITIKVEANWNDTTEW